MNPPAHNPHFHVDLDDVEALIAVRHDLHAHPQLAYEETYASEAVQRLLTSWDVPFVANIAKTGVVAWLTPTDPAAASLPALALRADMDALPITEETGLPYASVNQGQMHACGHDGHTAILLGAAQSLAKQREQLKRPVKFLFQPAEEVGAGAKKMIDAGVLTSNLGKHDVACVVGFHNWPALPQGTMAVAPGPAMAGTDLLRITVTGSGGHAAMPHLGVDLNVATAALVQALQTVISRNICPTDAAVLSISRVWAGEAHNVLPSSVKLEGTLRHFNIATQRLMHQRIEQIAHGLGLAYDCTISATFDEGYPPTVNDPAIAADVANAAAKAGLNVLDHEPPSTAAEDFSFFGQHLPTAYARLGAAYAGRETPNLHSDRFDFNDALIVPAVRMLVCFASY